MKIESFNESTRDLQRMIIPVRCFSCGKVLANKWNYYQREVRKRKGPGYAEPTCFAGKPIPKTPEAIVMDELGLDKMCCRKTVLTHVDLLHKI